MMEIYVRIHSEEDGTVAWWNYDKEDGESYLMDGQELWCLGGPYGEYCRGTAFNSVKEAKREARQAIITAFHDGTGDPKATFWRFVRGKLVQTKFTRDNKIKKF